MKKLFSSFLFISTALFSYPTTDELREELGLKVNVLPKEKTCHLYLVHHGSTAYSEIKRLQGWIDLPLSERGVKEINALASRLSTEKIAAIYASSLQSSVETGKILQEKLSAPLYPLDALRGEFHAAFDGLTREEYEIQPHFQHYNALPREEELFYPCGLGGESKVDVARRVVPALKKIAAAHLGQQVIVVLHGGTFKLLNFYLKNDTVSIPYGEMMVIEGDANDLYLAPASS